MYDLGQHGYDHDAVLKMLKSNRTITYRAELLDKEERSLGDLTATGYIDFDSNATIKRCASLNIKEESDIDFTSDRIKLYQVLINGTEKLLFPLGVFLLNSPRRRSDSSGYISRTIDCYDKTQILSDDKFESRYSIPEGSNYVNSALNIIASAGLAHVKNDVSDKTTRTVIEFDAGTSKLDAVNALLRAVNFDDIYADSNGEICVRKYVPAETRTIEAVYDTGKQSIVCAGAEELLDVFYAPNKIVRYLESADLPYMYASVVNDDPNSKLSTVSRGRTIVDIASVSDIADQTSLEAYVQRIAAEKKIYQYINFSTANMPNHEFLDCLYIDNKDLNVSGKYIETAWRMEIQNGGIMTHTARKAVSI